MKTDNELIAEFMGFISHQSETYGIILQHPDLMGTYQDHTRPNQHGKAMELKYHSSWSWIMPVVEKIDKETNFEFTLLITASFDEVYKSVVEFIKWYNDQPKQ